MIEKSHKNQALSKNLLKVTLVAGKTELARYAQASNKLFFYFGCKGHLLIATILQGAFLLFIRGTDTVLNQ
ncbi:hypothetical protein [Candidatus Cardinium sp. cByotN1]|uniref:hypothetical protein n=1 Tax=Candidatus Cardinium sp. cByotN1 TaxID=2699439 RepID=UPI001FB3DEDD|nr:hypothetical protein [Candidatus Cardinium sp. cByotN1]